MNLFFPSHDIALGNGVKHFNPPKAAQMLQEDLAWLEEIFNARPLSEGWGGSVWGWDWDTRQYLNKEHRIPLCQLPTDDDLEAIRQLSSRKTTIDILQALHFEGQMPKYLTTAEELDSYINREDSAGRTFVLKTPWSSSGRGLIRSSVTPRELMKRRALSTMQKMGGIMAEHWFPKKQDFAMLFHVGGEEVSYIGYSLFDNEDSGTYRQGYLLSNEEIERRLTDNTNITCDQLHALRDQLLNVLNKLFSPFFGKAWKVGYIGIDMMTINEENTSSPLDYPTIHPCVELNLRCTMGIICRLWSDRNLPSGRTGHFIISPIGDDGHFEARFTLDEPQAISLL